MVGESVVVAEDLGDWVARDNEWTTWQSQEGTPRAQPNVCRDDAIEGCYCGTVPWHGKKDTKIYDNLNLYEVFTWKKNVPPGKGLSYWFTCALWNGL